MNKSSELRGDDLIAFELADVPNALTQIGRLGEGIKAEFDLIMGRMSWLVIAESFIFSAFATVIVNFRADHPLVGVMGYLAWVLPFVGMFLAATVYLAIVAALGAIVALKKQRERMMARLPSHLQIDLISAGSRIQWWGNVPAHVIPPVLFIVWAAGLVLALLRH